MDKKTFALNAIRPYAKDPSLCGIDSAGTCMNLTPDGKMCVAGKHLLPHVREANPSGLIVQLLSGQDQTAVFVPEAANILTSREWEILQVIHDKIASKDLLDSIISYIKQLNLFTYEEMMS